MKPPIKRSIKAALKRVNNEILGNSRDGSRFSGGLASEGYAGGYSQALMDVLLLMNGVLPDSRGYWKRSDTEKKGQP